MDVEAVPLLPLNTSRVHYRAEAHTLTRVPTIHALGLWHTLSLAQQSCREHDESESASELSWHRRYNGLWEAHGETHRYLIVLFLGPFA